MSTIDLNRLHHAVHQVTGDMAVHFNRATADDLARWAKALRDIADEMEAEAVPETENENEIAFP